MAVTLFPLSLLYSLLIGDCSTPLSIQSASSLHKVTSDINTSSFTHDYHNFEKNQKITLFNFRCSNVAEEVRFLRFWEARNLRKGGELMSVDMLFVDGNLRFREHLSEGSLYTLTGFDVVRSNTNFRLSDASFSIRFNEGTSLGKVTAGENVCVSMFDSLPLAFHTKLDSYGREPRVVIATSVNPKIVGGMRIFTHLYFDSETAAGIEVFDMYDS
uniref:Uncharacterized protein n=1 Tax=Brassica oleracea TaxID=3712 RepID=A0A3P6GEE1_BRAOL|nr:unnamed protein product [Brassica oleracea]